MFSSNTVDPNMIAADPMATAQAQQPNQLLAAGTQPGGAQIQPASPACRPAGKELRSDNKQFLDIRANGFNCIQSPNGVFSFVLESDGLLHLRKAGEELWTIEAMYAPGKDGFDKPFCSITEDGDFACYNGKTSIKSQIWSTRTSGKLMAYRSEWVKPFFLQLTDEGSVKVHFYI
jgi:hypothetical protein